jgi:cytochrome c peroxidase
MATRSGSNTLALQDLIAFLRALDDPNFDRTVPQRVPSGLPVGGRLQR